MKIRMGQLAITQEMLQRVRDGPRVIQGIMVTPVFLRDRKAPGQLAAGRVFNIPQ